MKFYPTANGNIETNREKWLQRLLYPHLWREKVKPPESWVHMQVNLEKRTEAAAYSIWFKYYKPERKYIIWDQAPDEDWIKAGYLVE